MGRRSRKNRRADGSAVPSRRPEVNGNDESDGTFEPSLPEAGDKTVDLARDMLAALKSDGFEAFTPSTPKSERSRRTRRRRPIVTEFGAEEAIASPSMSDDPELSEIEEGYVSGDQHRMPSRPGTPASEGDADRTFTGDAEATIRRR